ncbi:MAG: hypothetical protein ACE15F_13630 [bacterium]
MPILHLLNILCGLAVAILPARAQTVIAKEQIEDAFLLKTGGFVYGDLTAATSTIRAQTLAIVTKTGTFHISQDGPNLVLRSNVDLVLDPSDNGRAGAVIVPATMMEFPDFLGDKIRFFSHSYKIGISPFDLDITSDRNIKFHSDTVPDLMQILGDEGNVEIKQDLKSGRDMISGRVFKFAEDEPGDKMLLYDTLYKLAVSPDTFDFYSDWMFAWHSDTLSNALTLDAETGRLTLAGPLQLPVYGTLPDGNVGELIYFDHPADDNQDGAYIYTSTGWQKL